MSLSLTVLLTFMLAAFGMAQSFPSGMPATVYFTPYRAVNCTMSEDIISDELPSSFAVTSGRCYNSTYPFASYVQATNFNTGIPCAMSIFTQTGCTGDAISVEFSTCAKCIPAIKADGESFQLACGP